MTTIWRIMSFFSRKEGVIIETFNKNEKVGGLMRKIKSLEQDLIIERGVKHISSVSSVILFTKATIGVLFFHV